MEKSKSNNRPLLALKDRPISSSGGFVIPIAKEGENNIYEHADRLDFPNNGRIWVSSEYEIVDRRFADYEFFRVNRYSADDTEAYIENDYLEKYWMRGSDTEALNRFVMCPIIEEELPDVERPYLKSISPLPNRAVFVNDGHCIFGPFEWAKDEEGLRLSAAQSPLLGLKPDHVFKVRLDVIGKYIIKFDVFRNYLSMPPAAYLFNTNFLKTVDYDQYDYISDDRLVTWGNKYFLRSGSVRLNRKTATEWLEAIKILKNVTGMDKERRSRLIRLIPEMLDAGNQQASFINNFLTNEIQGKKIVEQYIEDNKERFFKEQLKHIEERAEKEAARIRRDIYFLNAKKDQFYKEIEELRKKKTEEKNSYEQKRIRELQAIEERMEKRIRYEDLDKEISELEDKKTEIEAKVNLLQSEDIKTKLAEIKTYLDLLNGSYTREQENTEPSPQPVNIVRPKAFNGTPKEYVEKIHDYLLNQCGRNYSFDETANILICIQQSFMIILAGAPGIGKTSVMHYLAEAMGNIENLLKIPVSRGWTSQRDILGYFNPLRNQYQKARTGLYDFLHITQTADGASEFPRWLLLDEANLSPIEHYWADFLGMCDPEGERNLDTGCADNQRFLHISPCVRFIGTVNNDNTTERLSPRLIDRMPVIRFEPSYEYSNPINSDRIKPDEALTASKMQEFFAGSEEDDFAGKETEIVKEIVEILQTESADYEGSPFVVISPRKYYAIKRYCTVARDIFVDEQAIDFAMAQHILPLIEGYGTGFGKRLERLDEVATRNSLYRSARLLRRIIETGRQAHNSYSFFS
ncbi:MAG: hypothetical protein B6245_09750 [Desulfobacteraceae bacterium 4572_88]|nr:MAG: hypothetical protein B6245_09750 [Desulfobacteraceae bacterium 4572_88]